MPGTDPATMSGYLAAHALVPASMGGTNGVAAGAYNGYSAPGGYSAPIYRASAVNGLPALEFVSTGAGSAYSKNLAPAASPPNFSAGAFPTGLTVFAVVKPTDIDDLGAAFYNDRRSVLGMCRVGESTSSFGLRKYGSVTSSRLTLTSGSGTELSPGGGLASYPEGSWALVGFRTDGTNVKSYKGIGEDRAGVNPLAPAYGQYVSAFCLGNDFAYDGRSFDGQIAYFGAIGRAVTDNEWLALATYLLDRYGLPLRGINYEAFTGTRGDVFISFHGSADGKGAYLTSVAANAVGYSVNGGALVKPTPLWRPYGNNDEYSDNVLVLVPTFPLLNTDSVTVTVPSGAVQTTLGICEEFAAGAVANNVGAASLLPQEVPTGRTMLVGYNLNSQGAYYQPYLAYRNLWKTAEISNESGLVVAPDGTVTSCPSGVTYLIKTDTTNGDWPSPAGVRPGRYRLRWTYAGGAGSSLSLVNFAGDAETVVALVSGPTALGGGVYESIYNVTAAATAPAQRALFSLVQSAHAPFSNVWVGLEGYDPNATVHFDTLFKAKFTNVASVRFMDAMQTNFSNLADIDELTQVTDSRFTVVRSRRVAVSRIESYDGSPFWPATSRQFWKVTTAVPHGMPEGQSATIKGAGNTAVPVTLTTRGTVDTHNLACSLIWLIDSTSFAFAEYTGSPTRTTVTPWTGSGAELDVPTVCNMPVERMGALVSEIGAEYCHVTFPNALTDAAITHLGTRLANTVPSGSILRAEFANEPWNGSFSQFVYMCQQSVRLGGSADAQSYYAGYVNRSFQMLSLLRAAFVAAGRPSTDVELVLNVQNAGTGQSTAVAAYAVAHGFGSIQGVVLMTAPYMPAVPWGRLSGVDYSGWTLARVADHNEAYAKSFDSYENLYIHRANLVAAGCSHWGLETYESQAGFGAMASQDLTAGFDPVLSGYPLRDAQSRVANRQAIAMASHPSQYGITVKRFQDAQAAGVALNHTYNAFHAHTYEFSGYSVSAYGDNSGLTTVAGRGAGNPALLTDGAGVAKFPVSFTPLESPRALATLDWASGADPVGHLTGSWGLVTSPTPDPLTLLALTFSEAVVGVAKSGITLTLAGSSVSLASATLSGSGAAYTLSGLSALTTAAGAYVLRLDKTGVEGEFPPPGDTVALTLAADVVRSWTVSEPDVGPGETHRCFSGLRRGRRFV